MIVNVDELTAGCVLCRDVFSKSLKPLIKSGTVLNETHIEFLKAFLITHVDAEQLKRPSRRKATAPEKKQAAKPKPSSASESVHAYSPQDEKYRYAVKDYRHFFQHWQSGEGVSIGDFRSAMIPVISSILDEPTWLASFFITHKRAYDLAERSVLFGILAAFIAKRFKFSSGDINQFGLAGMLADCGLAKLPPSLLGKHELAGDEVRLFKRHVIDSYKMLKGIQTLKDETLIAIIQHHECEDGSGYPLNIEGSQSHLNGKLLAVCDRFLTQTAMEASGNVPLILEHLRTASYGKLSRFVLEKFCYELMTLFVGMQVQLSDGMSGEVTFIPVKDPMHPIIHLTDNRVIPLTENSSVFIESFL